MITIQEEESIYSLIYRAHQVNGISDLSNIIESDGRFATLPRFYDDTLHLYKSSSDRVFLDLLLDIGATSYARRILGYPFIYHDQLNYLFGFAPKKKQRTSSRRIYYCIDCIQYQIKNVGFGYLKSDWILSEYCKTHDNYLWNLKTSSRVKTIRALKNILRGINVDESALSLSNYISEYDRRDKPGYYVDRRLGYKLRDVIFAHRKEFSIEVDKEMTKRMSLTFRTGGLTKDNLKRNYILEQLYASLKIHEPEFIKEFHKNYTKEVIYTGGIIDEDSITERVFTLLPHISYQTHNW